MAVSLGGWQSGCVSTPPTAPGAARFAHQAATFERRAGLGDAGEEIARRLGALVGGGPETCWLEIGAGTGAVGRFLAEAGPRYIGLEASAPMLDRFREALTADSRADLLLADCNVPWPVPDEATDLVLASRVVHLLDADHTVLEAARVLRPRGWFLLGGVDRDPASVKDQLRARMRAEMTTRGHIPRDRRTPEAVVVQRLLHLGWESIPPHELAEWAVPVRPRDVLDAWWSKIALGGVRLPNDEHRAILEAVAAWATARFGSLNRVHRSIERYVVSGARAPASSAVRGSS